MRRETKFNHAFQKAIAGIIILGLLFWLGTQAFRPLKLDNIEIASGEMLSHTSDSKLLCERILARTGFDPYFQSQISFLQKKIDALVQQLTNSEVENDLQAPAADIRKAAEETNFDLYELTANLQNDAEVQKLLESFDALARHLDTLHERLKQKQKSQ